MEKLISILAILLVLGLVGFGIWVNAWTAVRESEIAAIQLQLTTIAETMLVSKDEAIQVEHGIGPAVDSWGMQVRTL